MADTSSAVPSAINLSANHIDKLQKPKPEKPDEVLFKESIEKAEAELKDAQEKLVWLPHNFRVSFLSLRSSGLSSPWDLD